MSAASRPRIAPLSVVLALAFAPLAAGCSESSSSSGGGTTTTSDISCDPAPKGSAVPFVEAAKEWGLDFVHHTQTPYCDIRDAVGGPGVCAFDYDRDGDVDLYFTDRAPYPNRLYRNDAGKLTDVTMESGAGIVNDSHCCLAFDYDADGDLDLFVGSSGADKLLRNDGGKFTDATDAAGLVETGYSTTATAGDIDGDGDLDLFVGHLITPSTCPEYCSPSPKACKAEKNALFVNDGGKFHDASEERGIPEENPTLASLFFDFDLDGDLDLYVGNDIGQSNPDRLYKNDGKGFFHDAAPGLGLTLYGTDTMGVDVGDTDGDGRTDLVITDFRLSPTRLVRCPNPNLNCEMVGISAASADSVKWAVALADFDHDRDLDIFTVSGNVEVPDGYPGDLHQLHWNDGTGTFTLYTPSAGEALAERHIGRGAAFADLDGDLDLDVVIANAGQPAQILINQAASGHALLVELDSLSAGARVTVEGKDVKRLEHALVGGGYAGSSDPRVHFGLGETCAVDVTVEWPGGEKRSVPGVRAGQSIRIERP
jgi:hypothetical protein